MKFYRHYKNKNYKYYGIAKHSESLEDMVVYKPLYSNPEGNLWVRPKDMFFEDIVLDGKTVPRFKSVKPEIKSFKSLDLENTNVLYTLVKQVFEDLSLEDLKSKLKLNPEFLVQIAYFEQTPVGFKIGYKISNGLFYSWLGGVLPEYRSLGVGQALMTDQHEWCLKSGFFKIQTKTKNSFKEMLILNLKSGFSVIEILPQESGAESKILLEKTLNSI